jgi:2-deoxy-D-gluconate 3-dehydrogenase
MKMFGLDGKVAVVTGATRGIGRAAALGLAEAGAHVVVLGNTHDPELTCNEVRALGRESIGFQGDIAEGGFLDRMVCETLARWNHIDVLVNSAGIAVRAPATDFSDSEWDRIIDLNLTSLFRLCQRVGRQMIKQKRGKIINIASILGLQGGINASAYAASKGAVVQVTRALANEWAIFQVNVNAIAPGYIKTDLTEPLYNDPQRSKEIINRIPAQRWGKPEDLVGAVVFLASPASDWVHGHVLVVDGGWMAR